MPEEITQELPRWQKFNIPVVYIAGLLLAATAAHLAWGGWPTARSVWAGMLLLGVGLGMNLLCVRMMKRHQTAILPRGAPSTLLRSGPFRYFRNPIYQGMLLAMGGVALAVGSLPFFLIIPVMWRVLRRRFVPMEEANLARVFGEQYAAYCREVPRGI